MFALCLTLGLLAAFVAAIVIRALRFVPCEEPETPAEHIPADQAALAAQLQAMLRLPTVSATEEGLTDDAVFESFRALLARLYPTLFARCAPERHGRHGLLLRIQGRSPDAPSVLMAHYDVVPAEEEGWTHPPFAGDIMEGELWGRGALDTKCTVMGILAAAEALLREGFVPRNDVYLSLGGDEETLGQDASAIVDALEARSLRPAFVLDEGGAVVDRVFPGVSRPAALVGIAEKGSAFVDVCAAGRGGHASAPPSRQAVGQLCRALVNIQKRQAPFTLTAPARALFDTLGRHAGFGYRLIFANLWCFRPLLDLVCRQSGGELNALVRTTAALTRLSASPAYNVLPAEASAGVNLRLIPGDSAQAAMDRLRRVLGKTGATARLVKASAPSPVSPAEGQAWQRLGSAIAHTFPGVIRSPYLMMAASDSRHYCRISEHVYRFSPLSLDRARLGLIHNQDERIRLDLLGDIYRFYIRVLRQC